MLKRDFGKTNWKISSIGLGTWNIGNQWGEMDDETAVSIIKAAYDKGMNLFDVAESYGIPSGLSEIRLGKALKEMNRKDVYLVSKIGHFGSRTGCGVPKKTIDMIRLCGHACLGRLQTSYIDLMLCHDGGIKDPSIYINGFQELKKEGFIREYGISTDDLDVLKKFYDTSGGQCAAVELDYSLINRKAEIELLNYCQEKNLGVLVRGALAQGLLSGKYNEDTVFTDTVRSKWNREGNQRKTFEEKLTILNKLKNNPGLKDNIVKTGLQYVISHPCNPVAIPGATSIDQAVFNAGAGDSLLSDDILKMIQEKL
ncbi:MAG: aldo/keto reductase [Spirochaetaceae bacterium]